MRFFQLPQREQRFLERRTIRAVVISIDSHPNMKFETFERLNTGAVVLNAQEIRNSLYRGEFNRMLRNLVKDESFRMAIGTKQPRKRMVDEELILRFFALRDGLKDYRPPLKRFLNEYMSSVQNPSKAKVRGFEELFGETISRVADVLGSNAFRITDSRGRALESAVNRALFEAQMLAFSWVPTAKALGRSRSRITSELASLYKRNEFQDSIQRATGDRARTLTRVRGVVEALRGAGVNVEAPRVI
jgi:hypothetical protein